MCEYKYSKVSTAPFFFDNPKKTRVTAVALNPPFFIWHKREKERDPPKFASYNALGKTTQMSFSGDGG